MLKIDSMIRKRNTAARRRLLTATGGVTCNEINSPSSSSTTLSSDSGTESTRSTIEQLPPELIMHILSYLTYDNVARLRSVSRTFNRFSCQRLNDGLRNVERYHARLMQQVKAQLPRRESERRNHHLARQNDILTAIETRLSLMHMTYGRFIELYHGTFIPGAVLDESIRVLRTVETTLTSNELPNRPGDVLQELRDISSMAMEHFDERIAPILRSGASIYSPRSLSQSAHATSRTSYSTPKHANSWPLSISSGVSSLLRTASSSQSCSDTVRVAPLFNHFTPFHAPKRQLVVSGRVGKRARDAKKPLTFVSGGDSSSASISSTSSTQTFSLTSGVYSNDSDVEAAFYHQLQNTIQEYTDKMASVRSAQVRNDSRLREAVRRVHEQQKSMSKQEKKIEELCQKLKEVRRRQTLVERRMLELTAEMRNHVTPIKRHRNAKHRAFTQLSSGCDGTWESNSSSQNDLCEEKSGVSSTNSRGGNIASGESSSNSSDTSTHSPPSPTPSAISSEGLQQVDEQSSTKPLRQRATRSKGQTTTDASTKTDNNGAHKRRTSNAGVKTVRSTFTFEVLNRNQSIVCIW